LQKTELQLQPMSKVKMIWDFKGPNAEAIAKHHVVHLNEFILSEAIEDAFAESLKLTEMYTQAFLVVPERYTHELRKRLKPHRGQRYVE